MIKSIKIKNLHNRMVVIAHERLDSTCVTNQVLKVHQKIISDIINKYKQIIVLFERKEVQTFIV